MDAAQVAVRIYRLKRAGFRRQHGAWQRGPWRVVEDAPATMSVEAWEKHLKQWRQGRS